MLKFNTLLSENGLDLKTVQLVRHQQTGPGGTTPFKLLSNAPIQFENYQRIQSRHVFRGNFIAAFVAAAQNETLFANLYKIEGVERNSASVACPLSLKEFQPGEIFSYNLRVDDRIADFSKRLVIRWGDGYRSWIQRAHRQNKDIVELRKQFEEPEYPGHRAFSELITNIPSLYPKWRSILLAERGVYLLVCNETGKQYVGSATGSSGFYGRWIEYAADGHGGNKLLKQHARKVYTVTILETAGSSESRDDILRLESRWKEKLGSRADRLGDEFGLNAG